MYESVPMEKGKLYVRVVCGYGDGAIVSEIRLRYGDGQHSGYGYMDIARTKLYGRPASERDEGSGVECVEAIAGRTGAGFFITRLPALDRDLRVLKKSWEDRRQSFAAWVAELKQDHPDLLDSERQRLEALITSVPATQ